MFDFFKRKNGDPPTDNSTSDEDKSDRTSVVNRLKDKLFRTRSVFREGLARIFLGKKEIDAQTLEALEDLLISADVGVEATKEITGSLQTSLSRQEIKNADTVLLSLKQILKSQLLPYEKPLEIPEEHKQEHTPFVILMVGVNGTGKTTTIGKLAKKFQMEGKSVLLAAGDTFRAAAIEQLQAWGTRNNIPVVAQHTGADSASVLFDAFQAAKAKNIDILIADTAGRLHTHEPLMDELKKIIRVLQKANPSAPHEIMLVLDAGIGQNALMQAKKFHEMISLTGITLTKLDGTAKGGIVFNITKNLKLPIRFVGVGEGSEDLRPFSSEEFVEALFN